jgi:hypothetical protein
MIDGCRICSNNFSPKHHIFWYLAESGTILTGINDFFLLSCSFFSAAKSKKKPLSPQVKW